MMNVIMLIDVMLNVVMLTVVVPLCCSIVKSNDLAFSTNIRLG